MTAVAAAAALAARPVVAPAATYTWDGFDTNNLSYLSLGDNWSGGSAPPSDGTADLVFGGTSLDANTPTDTTGYNVDSVTFNSSALAYTLTTSTYGRTMMVGAGGINDQAAIAELITEPLALSANQAWTLGNSAGMLTVANGIDTGSHTLTVNATGTFNASTYLAAGYTAGTTGTLNLFGNGVVNTPALYAGYSGAGTVNQAAGTVNVTSGGVAIGGTAGTAGTYVLSGGTLTTTNLAINAGGVLSQVGGTLTAGSVAQTGGIASIGALVRTSATLSQARGSLAGTAVGTKAIFAGGATSSANSNVVDIYDNATGSWSTAALSQARSDLAATSVGTKAIFAGGSTGGSGAYSNVVDIYDNASGSWSTAALSQARYALAATSVGTKAIFAGGAIRTDCSSVVDIYDNSTGAWSTATLSQARQELVATSVGTKAIFAGGIGDSGISNVVDIYDNSSGSWTSATLSQARSDLAATSVGTKAIFAGGISATTESNVVDIYDNSSGTWSTATLSQARFGLAATSVGTKAIFAGGYIGGGAYTNAVDIYDSNNGLWFTSTLSGTRYNLAAASVGTKAIFAGGFGGGSSAGSDYSNVADLYDVNNVVLSLGTGTSNVGAYALSGGTLSATLVNVTAGGSLTQTGGTLTVATVNQSGGSATFSGKAGLNVSSVGVGAYYLSGGTLSAASVGTNANGGGTLYFNGGTLRPTGNNASFLSVNNAVVLAGGAVIDTQAYNVTIAQLLVGSSSSPGGGLTKLGTGTLSLIGPSTYTGTTNVSAGMLAVASTGLMGTAGSSVTVGAGTGAAGTFTLADTAVLRSSQTFVGGAGGTGAFVQTGGTHTAAAEVYVGFNVGGSGIYQLSSGSVVTPELNIGAYGRGTVNQSGGTVSLSRLYLGYFAGGIGTYNLSGGTLATAFASTPAGTGTLTLSGGTLQATNNSTGFLSVTNAYVGANGFTFDTEAYTVSAGQALLASPAGAGGGLTKVGTGTLTLTAANTYTGPTNASAGILATGTTGTLGTGNVTVGGSLVLGNANSIADTVTVSFTNGSTIQLNAVGGSEAIAGLFDLTTSTSFTTPGTYSAVYLDGKFGDSVFAASSNETVTIVVATPEPASLALVGVTAGPLALGRRRRRWSRCRA